MQGAEAGAGMTTQNSPPKGPPEGRKREASPTPLVQPEPKRQCHEASQQQGIGYSEGQDLPDENGEGPEGQDLPDENGAGNGEVAMASTSHPGPRLLGDPRDLERGVGLPTSDKIFKANYSELFGSEFEPGEYMGMDPAEICAAVNSSSLAQWSLYSHSDGPDPSCFYLNAPNDPEDVAKDFLQRMDAKADKDNIKRKEGEWGPRLQHPASMNVQFLCDKNPKRTPGAKAHNISGVEVGHAVKDGTLFTDLRDLVGRLTKCATAWPPAPMVVCGEGDNDEAGLPAMRVGQTEFLSLTKIRSALVAVSNSNTDDLSKYEADLEILYLLLALDANPGFVFFTGCCVGRSQDGPSLANVLDAIVTNSLILGYNQASFSQIALTGTAKPLQGLIEDWLYSGSQPPADLSFWLRPAIQGKSDRAIVNKAAWAVPRYLELSPTTLLHKLQNEWQANARALFEQVYTEAEANSSEEVVGQEVLDMASMGCIKRFNVFTDDQKQRAGALTDRNHTPASEEGIELAVKFEAVMLTTLMATEKGEAGSGSLCDDLKWDEGLEAELLDGRLGGVELADLKEAFEDAKATPLGKWCPSVGHSTILKDGELYLLGCGIMEYNEKYYQVQSRKTSQAIHMLSKYAAQELEGEGGVEGKWTTHNWN